MNFKEFVDLTRPVIGGKGGIQKYVRTLFEAILDEEGPDILGDYSDSSYKASNCFPLPICKASPCHSTCPFFGTEPHKCLFATLRYVFSA